MQLDRKRLDRLLEMNDEQLGALIQTIAQESGVDPAALGLNPNSIESVRRALSLATEEDLRQLNQIYTDYRKNHRSH
jgi:hypothetical protein